MICHSLYRVRKFDLLETYLTEFNTLKSKSNSSISRQFDAKLILLKASNYALTNRIEKAIQLLEIDYTSFSIHDNISQSLNLGLYYFMNKEHSKAVKTNQKIGQTESDYSL